MEIFSKILDWKWIVPFFGWVLSSWASQDNFDWDPWSKNAERYQFTKGGEWGEEEWNTDRLLRVIAQLGHELFWVREEGSRELANASTRTLNRIREAWKNFDDPEIRERLEEGSKQVFLERILPFLPEWKKGRGFLGIQWSISSDPPGVMVFRVLPESAAETAGLLEGDLITSVDGADFKQGFAHQNAMDIWSGMAPGDKMNLQIKRGESPKKLTIQALVGEFPQEMRDDSRDEQRALELWQAFLYGNLQIPQLLKNPLWFFPSGREDSDLEEPLEPKPLQSWPDITETSG